MARIGAFLSAVSSVNSNEGRDSDIVTETVDLGFIAEFLGIDRPDLRCLLGQLEEDHVIDWRSDGGLRIQNTKALEKIADEISHSSADDTPFG